MSKVEKVLKLVGKLPADVLIKFNDTVNSAISLYETVEKENTAREGIRAKRDVAVGDIEAKRAILEKYLDLSFNERAEVFRRQFDALDKAITDGSTQLAIAALNAVVETIRTSPLSSSQEIRALMTSDAPLLLE